MAWSSPVWVDSSQHQFLRSGAGLQGEQAQRWKHLARLTVEPVGPTRNQCNVRPPSNISKWVTCRLALKTKNKKSIYAKTTSLHSPYRRNQVSFSRPQQCKFHFARPQVDGLQFVNSTCGCRSPTCGET